MVTTSTTVPTAAGRNAVQRLNLSAAALRTGGLLLLTLGAFALRVHNLAAESLDIDEADVVVYALADLRTVLERLLSAGDNGPAYMLLVRYWIAAAGQSEFALRFLSVLPGALTVPLFYALGRKLFDYRVGIAAAVMGTASTYLLFYAQMNKMYALVVCLTLLSSHLLLRAVETARWRAWLAYTVAATALMAAHIFGALAVPWHALYALWMLRRSRAHLWPWLTSLALLTLPYVPAGLARLGALERPETLARQFTGPRDYPGMFVTLAREYGTRFDDWGPELFAVAFSALSVAGVAALAWRWPAARDRGLVFVLLGVLLPGSATFGLVVLGAPLFASRYLIPTLPFYYLLWAGAAAALLGRRTWPLGVVLLALFVAANGLRWWPTAFAGVRYREDFRAAVTSLQRQYQPGDLVVTLHDSVANGVRYYSASPLLITSLEGGPGNPPNRAKLTAQPATGRLWLVATYVEAEGLTEIENWLQTNAGLGGKRWYNGVMVAEFNRR
jgi:4-amino-4-deoxy-L-arabinose transferase-like glycosyltransferase